MAKVIFSISYEVAEDKRDEYLNLAKELKSLLKADGLESYELYEVKGKKNHFNEIYTFGSEEAFEQFDDDQNERINVLINRLSELTSETKYTTMYQALETVAAA